MTSPASPSSLPPLRICVDANLTSGRDGGIEQAVIGLATGLSRLTDGNEQYLFDCPDGWIDPYLSGGCRRLPGPPPRGGGLRSRAKASVRRYLPFVPKLARRFRRPPPPTDPVPPGSDGRIEAAGVDLMHFTHQAAFRTRVPSLYQPWDLQHLHLPQLFSPRMVRHREVLYRAFCDQAAAVVAASSWGRRDLMAQYGLPAEKVIVVPAAAPTAAYVRPSPAAAAAVRAKFGLPEAFVFYPAQTWPHKNHAGLLAALHRLRARDGLTIPLVCSGFRNDYYPTVRAGVRELGLGDQVRFVGFVEPVELSCLYELCRAVVFPSRFEGWGLPVTEALQAGVPVACSAVTCLPDQVGDAAVLFDPDNPEAIADAVRAVWADADLRRTLAERGRRRAALFTWDRTARLFRAHYRRLAARPLDESDRRMLAAPPIV